MKPRGIVILGTGTGVGKTVVTAALGIAMQAAGRPVAVWKPVAAGGLRHGRRIVSGDAVWLRRVLDLHDPLDVVGGVCFALPLAPAVAARLEGAPLDVPALLRRWARIRAGGRFVLVEGVGGVLVPLAGRVTGADFARRLGIPAIVVGAAGLGTINHTLLTLEALRARRVPVAGVVLNGARGRDRSEDTNAGVIESLGRTRVLAVLPHVAGIRTDGAALRRLARRVPIRSLLRACGESR